MKKISFLLSFIALSIIAATLGCGTAPRPTPAPTLAPVIITVVITPTPQAVADTPAPFIAVTSTLTTSTAITTTGTAVAQARATNTTAPTARSVAPTATRRPNTATPTKAGTAAPTGIPFVAKYASPVNLIGPLYEGPNPGDRRDTRTYGADALVFEWQSNGGLGDGECYLIHVDMKSRADASFRGDAFLFCDKQQTLKGPAQPVQFTLNKPNFTPGPTYAGLIPPGGGDVDVSWYVTIAKDEGPASTGGFYYYIDASRHNITLLGPNSRTFTFLLKGAPIP